MSRTHLPALTLCSLSLFGCSTTEEVIIDDRTSIPAPETPAAEARTVVNASLSSLLLADSEVVDLGDGAVLFPTADKPSTRPHYYMPDRLKGTVGVAGGVTGGIATIAVSPVVSRALQQRVDAYKAAHRDRDVRSGSGLPNLKSLTVSVRVKDPASNLFDANVPLPTALEETVESSSLGFSKAMSFNVTEEGVAFFTAVRKGDTLISEKLVVEACAEISGIIRRNPADITSDRGPVVFTYTDATRRICLPLEALDP